MRVAVHHDAIADTVARLARTVRAFEDELDALDAAVARLKSAWNGMRSKPMNVRIWNGLRRSAA